MNFTLPAGMTLADLDPETVKVFERDARKETPVRKPAKIQTLEIWALMGIHAQDTKHGGAWRLHVLASSLDHSEGCNHVLGICKGGSGKVSRSLLEAEALKLGVKRSTFYAWLADARTAHILNGHGEYLYLASQNKLAGIFLLNSIDEHKTTIPAKLLFRPGWKALVFAAYLKANHSSPIGYDEKLQKKYGGNIVSRRKLDDLTGIEPRKQRRLNQYIKSRRNIAITNIPGTQENADTLNQAGSDNGKHRHYFVFNDPHEAGTNVFGEPLKYKRVIAHTLPNRYNVSDSHAKIGARGHRRQIKAAIEGLQLVIICNHSKLSARPRQAGRQTETFVKFPRVYFDELPKKHRNVTTPEERYLLRRKGAMADVFDVWRTE